MYSHSEDQIEFYHFIHPFGGKLEEENRWVQLSKLIPWLELEESYKKHFSADRGAPAKSARMAYGSLIIQEKCKFVDEELIYQIRENPYLQFFIGFKEYQKTAPLDSSTLVDFRKRISVKDVQVLIENMLKNHGLVDDKSDLDQKDLRTHQGQLLIDASCAPADITFPTDLKLLNHSRELTEEVIDILYEKGGKKEKKPRTYRKKARKEFLKIIRRKKTPKAMLRTANQTQLSFVQRNLRHIDKLSQSCCLRGLPKVLYKKLLVISEVARQQAWMLENPGSVEGRIVNLSQPHIRPIVRAKAGAKTEFGAKISLSVHNGFSFLHRVCFDNYNEGGDLIAQAEYYKSLHGFYPESIHADKIYRNRENLSYCRDKEIRLSGPALGRPSKDLVKNKAQKALIRKDEGIRNGVEGKFGQAKRRFTLGKVMGKLANTSSTKIAFSILVLNLEKLLLFYFSQLFSMLVLKKIGNFFSINRLNTWKKLNVKNILKPSFVFLPRLNQNLLCF